MSKYMDLVGQTYSWLTVIAKARPRRNKRSTVGYWKCRCVCGALKEIRTSNLRSGTTKSCGCMKATLVSQSRTKHGMSQSPEMRSYGSMITRCTNPNADDYERYGGRGIRVCKRWRRFDNFYADMGPRPTRGHSIERLNPNKGYSPSNCIWGTREQQDNNTTRTRYVTLRGKTKPMAIWARELGIPYHVLNRRVYRLKWDDERTISTPCPTYTPRTPANAQAS